MIVEWLAGRVEQELRTVMIGRSIGWVKVGESTARNSLQTNGKKVGHGAIS